MNKLTQQEAQDLIQKAWQMVTEHHLGGYRFGQALWNLIHNDLQEPYALWVDTSIGRIFEGYQKDVDFFYWQDSDKVTETFYKYFVEEN